MTQGSVFGCVIRVYFRRKKACHPSILPVSSGTMNIIFYYIIEYYSIYSIRIVNRRIEEWNNGIMEVRDRCKVGEVGLRTY